MTGLNVKVTMVFIVYFPARNVIELRTALTEVMKHYAEDVEVNYSVNQFDGGQFNLNYINCMQAS